MSKHTKKKPSKDYKVVGPGGESPSGGKPERGQDVLNKAKKATPLDPNAQKQMKKAEKGGKGKAKDQKIKKIPGKMGSSPASKLVEKGYKRKTKKSKSSIVDRSVSGRIKKLKDMKDKAPNFYMIPGSKEKDTPGAFRDTPANAYMSAPSNMGHESPADFHGGKHDWSLISRGPGGKSGITDKPRKTTTKPTPKKDYTKDERGKRLAELIKKRDADR